MHRNKLRGGGGEWAQGSSGTELPAPPNNWWKGFLGPTAILTATAIGSGELIFWPGLTIPYGAGILWLSLAALLTQYFLNIEIARYSLATGESVAIAAARSSRTVGIALLCATIIPWLWAGWARAAGQTIAVTTGIQEKPLSIVLLLLCGVFLGAPRIVYRPLERLQTVLLTFMLISTTVLITWVVITTRTPSSFWHDFFLMKGMRGLIDVSLVQMSNAQFLGLVSAIVFAGAGGVLNLTYGLMICEKKLGMGAFSKGIQGLKASRGLERPGPADITFSASKVSAERWRVLLRMSATENLFLFVGGSALSILCLSWLMYVLLGGTTGVEGISIIGAAARALGDRLGGSAALLFVALAFTIMITSEIGILDATSRLAAGTLRALLPGTRLTTSSAYHLFVWLEICVGVLIIVLDPRQPYWFLVTSAVLNTASMALYAAILARRNSRLMPPLTRPSAIGVVTLYLIAVIYGALFVVSVVGRGP